MIIRWILNENVRNFGTAMVIQLDDVLMCVEFAFEDLTISQGYN